MMKKTPLKIALATTLLCSATATMAEDQFYFSALAGYSEQITDSSPYGNNIAKDDTFPSAFDAGDGAVYSIGIGYKFTPAIRFEARLATREGSFTETQDGTGSRAGDNYVLDGEIETTTLTFEAFYDFHNDTIFTPYIKAGVGVADNSYSARLGGPGIDALADLGFINLDSNGYYSEYNEDDSTEFTWNIGAGVAMDINDRVAVYAEYQYADFGDVATTQDAFTDGFRIDGATANEFLLGLTVTF